MPSQREARRLLALADRGVRSVEADVLRALKQLSTRVTVAELELIIRTRDVARLERLTHGMPFALRRAAARLERVLVSGAREAAVQIGMEFNARDPMVIRSARQQAARFVTGVSRETQAAIRGVMVRSLSEGIPPRDAARLIRPLVGLNRAQAGRVARLYGEALAQGRGQMAARREAVAEAGRMVRRRALTIARTETIRASAEGHQATWRAAQREGLLPPNAVKEWITTDDDITCPVCRPLGGQQVQLKDQFRLGLLERISGPPAHPNCRCALAVSAPLSKRRAA